MRKTEDTRKQNGSVKGRTVVFSKKHTPNAAAWVRWLEEHCIASAGPHPSLVGMRNQFWGRSALVVRAGAYLYLLKHKDDGKALPWE